MQMGQGVKCLEVHPGDIRSPRCLGECNLQCVPDPLQHSDAGGSQQLFQGGLWSELEPSSMG